MPQIMMTQYLRPNGLKRETWVEVPRDQYNKAVSIVAAGFVFESEVLTTGDVRFTIADPKEEIDVGIEVCPNGPEVHNTLKRLIMDFKLPDDDEDDTEQQYDDPEGYSPFDEDPSEE